MENSLFAEEIVIHFCPVRIGCSSCLRRVNALDELDEDEAFPSRRCLLRSRHKAWSAAAPDEIDRPNNTR